MELLSPNWKPTERQLQPSETQRQRFGQREPSEMSTSEVSPSSRHGEVGVQPRAQMRRGSTFGNLASGLSLRRGSTISNLANFARRGSGSGGGGGGGGSAPTLNRANTMSQASSAGGRSTSALHLHNARRGRRGSVTARAARLIGRPKSEPPDSRMSTGSWGADCSARSELHDFSARTEADDGGPEDPDDDDNNPATPVDGSPAATS